MTKLEGMTNEQLILWRQPCRLHSFISQATRLPLQLIRHSSSSFVLGLAAAAIVSAEKRNITEKDLFDFVWIGDPQISPDGTRVAFVRVTVNEKKEGYNTSIWSVPGRGRRGASSTDKRRSRCSATLVAGREIFALRARHREGWKTGAAPIGDFTNGGRRFICVYRSAEGRQ